MKRYLIGLLALACSFACAYVTVDGKKIDGGGGGDTPVAAMTATVYDKNMIKGSGTIDIQYHGESLFKRFMPNLTNSVIDLSAPLYKLSESDPYSSLILYTGKNFSMPLEPENIRDINDAIAIIGTGETYSYTICLELFGFMLNSSEDGYFLVEDLIDILTRMTAQRFGIPDPENIEIILDNLNPSISYVSRSENLVNDGGIGFGIPKKIEKKSDYLYEMEYDSLDREFAKKYLNSLSKTALKGMACSGVVKDKYFGRNFDWIYDESETVVVRVSAKEGRYASVGTAGILSNLDRSLLESGIGSELFKVLPYLMMDGVNECGVAVSMNVIPYKKLEGVNMTTLLPVFFAVRDILDTCSSADEANIYLENHSFKFGSLAEDLGYVLHFMVADQTDAYVVEPFDIEDQSLPLPDPLVIQTYIGGMSASKIMTNFRCLNGEQEEDVLNDGRDAVDLEKIAARDPFGSGVARYNIAVSGYDYITDEDEMKAMMKSLWYTHMYDANTTWHDEYVGHYETFGTLSLTNLVTDPTGADFAAIEAHERARFANRSRIPGHPNYGTSHTVHTSVYDMDQKTLSVCVQENDEWFDFTLESSSGGDITAQLRQYMKEGFVLDGTNYIIHASEEPAE